MRKAEALYAQSVERFAQAAIDARDRIASVNDYIERVRDFWIAKSHLDTALIANSAP